MKITFRAPLKSSSWVGFLSNLILKDICKTYGKENIQTVLLKDHLTIDDKFLNINEGLIDSTYLLEDVNRASALSETDLQIIISPWKEAFDSLIKDAVNIVLGYGPDEFRYHLANVPIKQHATLVNINNYLTKQPSINEKSVINKLDLTKEFSLVIPNEFDLSKITSEDVKKWSLLDRYKKGTSALADTLLETHPRIIIYSPAAYNNPEALGQMLAAANVPNLDKIDFDIISDILSHKELMHLMSHENCSSYNVMGHTCTFTFSKSESVTSYIEEAYNFKGDSDAIYF